MGEKWCEKKQSPRVLGLCFFSHHFPPHAWDSVFFRTLKLASPLSLTSWHFSESGFWILTKGVKPQPVRYQTRPNSMQVSDIEQPSPDALNATQKTSGLCKVRFWRKSRKTLKNWPFFFFTILAKKGNFLRFFLIILETIKYWGILCCIQYIRTLLLSYQNPISDNFSVFVPKGGTLMI